MLRQLVQAELWNADQNKFGNFTQRHTTRATGNTLVHVAANTLQEFRAVEVTKSVNEDEKLPIFYQSAGLSNLKFVDFFPEKFTTEGH